MNTRAARAHFRPESFLYIACLSVLMEGCFSYTNITDEARNGKFNDPGKTIIVTCTDKNKIELDGYHYIAIKDSSGFVYGAGHYMNSRNEEGEPFRGTFFPATIDSSHTELFSLGLNTGAIRYYDCTGADSVRVRFRKGEVLTVPPGASPGIWYTKTYGTVGWDKPQNGMIPFEDIAKVKTKEFSGLKSAGIVSAALATALVGTYLMIEIFILLRPLPVVY
jgi:hypothetical protein